MYKEVPLIATIKSPQKHLHLVNSCDSAVPSLDTGLEFLWCCALSLLLRMTSFQVHHGGLAGTCANSTCK